MGNTSNQQSGEADKNKSASDASHDDCSLSELAHSRQEVARLTRELESCKKQLTVQEEALSAVKAQLKSARRGNKISEKEARLERMANEMERAQEMATMGSWVLEVETGEVTWTPELHRMFGQDPSCPVPTLEQQETWYTKKSWNAMIEAVTRTSQDGSPYNIELETIRRDGTVGILRSIGEAERDESGRIVRLRGVAQDISDIKEAEAKLKTALEQEKAALIYKDQFLANMSHEIRTPMNGIVGFASLLRDEDLDAETRDDYINTIESCSNQLLNLIDDILDLAKIEAGEIKIEKKPFHMAKLIKETAKTLETIQGDKGKQHIHLAIHIPEGSEEIEIHSDQLRIQQILTNLLSNALKFSEKGRIDFGYELEDEAVEFFVKDEGIGISPERIKLIFKRFEHFEGTDVKYEGTGLGLSISEGLAKILGATLSVESELGVGSVFRLRVPFKRTSEPENNRNQTKAETPGKQLRNCTVLVVEDELMNLKFIERALKQTELKTFVAHNGKEAVETYRKHPEIDVVLMDIRMPIMDGHAATQEILKFDGDAKIVAQTAYAMREEREKFIHDGFVDYISKPYQAANLIEIIKKWA